MSKNTAYNICEVTLIYQNKVKAKDRPKIDSPTSAANILNDVWDKNKIELVEQFKIILLDTSSRCLAISDIATGGINRCIADPKIVFATALKAKATAILLAHNHPSGNLNPSQEDIALTNKMISAGKLLDIQIVDHLIITSEGYYSMADNHLIP